MLQSKSHYGELSQLFGMEKVHTHTIGSFVAASTVIVLGFRET